MPICDARQRPSKDEPRCSLSEGKLDIPFPQCKIFLHQWDRFLFLLVGAFGGISGLVNGAR
jgi:hypothetical protein